MKPDNETLDVKNDVKELTNEIKNEFKKDLKNEMNNKSPIKKHNKKHFDVILICGAFEEFNKQPNSLPLDHYINGYKELSK